ncbi:MAG TPA: GTP-binding protein [Xanthobacteraceae bacterium]|nr:GTP-binding protein [Xanthobacteraceae bacterium]
MTDDGAPRSSAGPLGRSSPAEPIPLTVLTGFLGAGKTTLLNRLVQDPAMAGTAVIINEFGEIGLDHLLVKTIGDNMVLLQSGCLCCTLRGDLVTALENLLRDLDNGRVNFHRVVLETTGLADPAPLLQTAMAHPYLVMRYRLDGVVTVVDAINGGATLDQAMESVKQVAVADRLVLTKRDLIDTPERRDAYDQLMTRLKALNPAAPVLDAAAGEATADKLLDCGLYDPARKIPDVGRWLADEAYAAAQQQQHDHHHHDVNRHDARIRAFTFATDTPIPGATFEMFIDLVRSLHGPKLLRLKGIVKLAETPDQPLVIHGVQHVMHPPARLERWPDADQRTRIVVIARDLAPEAVTRLFDAFVNRAAPDRPDINALIDNPLIPFGGIDR